MPAIAGKTGPASARQTFPIFEVWREASAGRAHRRAVRGSYVTVHVPDREAGGSAPWPAAWRTAPDGGDARRRPADCGDIPHS